MTGRCRDGGWSVRRSDGRGAGGRVRGVERATRHVPDTQRRETTPRPTPRPPAPGRTGNVRRRDPVLLRARPDRRSRPRRPGGRRRGGGPGATGGGRGSAGVG